MERRPLTRQEVMSGYEHPYRRWLPVAWTHEHVPRNLGVAAALTVAALAADAIGGRNEYLVTWSLALAAMAVAWTLWVTGEAIGIIRGRTSDWRESGHELAAVRKRRPHAPEADLHLVHDEFAVAVDERSGELITCRFIPLAANESEPEGALLLTGIPRYAALATGRRPYDARDAARAAEQLADAQREAASLEAEAIRKTRQELERARAAKELAEDARSTGAALRGITGQAGD